MKITCIDKEVKQILETGYYSIPRFQRPYSWEKDHITEFWNDTIIESETDYFIGSFVIYKSNIDDVYGIVDGQQRLTTITMILCALRDLYKAYEYLDLAMGVQRLVERVDLSNKEQFILQTETSYPYFQEYIQKYNEPEIEVELGLEEQNLKTGYEIITSFLNEEVNSVLEIYTKKKTSIKDAIKNKLNEIRDKVLKLKVIYIELDDEDDAYIIFETLNTRGKDLSVSDLAKNYLTKLIKNNNSRVDLTKDKWNKIRETIDSSSADIDTDTFLLHVWLSKYEFTTLKTLFKKLKTTVKKSNAKSFLDEIVTDSSTYKNIFDPETKTWTKNEFKLKQSLIALNNFRVTQQTPMVLTTLREYYAGKIKYRHALEAISAIEYFHYIFTAVTSQRSSGGISSMYSTYARQLTNNTSLTDKANAIKELKQKMREKIPPIEEFLVNFKNLQFTDNYTKSKKLIQYSLAKYDEYYNTNGSSIDYNLMTLEHLLPQNPQKKIKDHNNYVGLIGNLILVDTKTNNDLANKDFTAKKVILAKTSLYIDDKISNVTTWEGNEILSRTEHIAKLLYTKVFKI